LTTGVLCAAAAPASAQQERPIQLSLIAPVQIFPETDAIKGFRFNLIYGRNAAMHGFDLGLVNHVTGPVTGVQWGFVNVTNAFVGWQDAIVNVNEGAFEGLQAGGVNTTGSMNGLQFGFVNYAERANGCVQIGLVNIIKEGGTFPVMIIANWGGF
jgi:hypothetical protein